MAGYELRLKKSVAKDLRACPKKDLKKVLSRIEALTDDPRPSGCEKLSAMERYRIRQGRYRILYEVDDREIVVIVVKVAHRSTAYRAVSQRDD